MKKVIFFILFIVSYSIVFSQINITETHTNVSCFGGSNGTIALTVTGGTGPYTYTWTPILPSTTNITGLTAGNYTVIVEDAVANTNSLVVTIFEPSQLTAVTSSTNSNCGQANGAMCASIAGGQAPYNTLWSNAAITLCNSNIPAGAYTFTVTDANNCIAVSSGLVNDIAGPMVSITSQTNISCYGLMDGAASATLTGGTSPYSYIWSIGSSTTSYVSNLGVGIHNLTVTDNAGCIGTVSVNITQPTPLTTSISSITNVSCNGNADGNVNIIVSGGTGAYAHLWSNGITVPHATNLFAGVYTYTVTDTNGCVATNSVIVLQPTQIAATITQTNTSCNNVCNGIAQVINSGGTAPYTYLWNFSTSPTQTTQVANNLCVGACTLYITDANNCQYMLSAYISPTYSINASVTHTNVSCFGDCNGQVQISNVTGGVAPYTYQTMPLNPQSNPLITGLCVGNYGVNVIDANGCATSQSVTINQPTQIIAATSFTNATCGQTNGSICAIVNGGTLPYNIIWNNSSNSICNNNLPAGAYSYTVVDAQGCDGIANKIISSTGGPLVSIVSQTNVSCYGLSNGGANVSVTGGTAPYTYSWTQTSTNSPTLSLVSSGIYDVIVTDAAGCVGTQSVVITQPSQLLVYTYSQPECGGGMCNGSINATINGGSGPYTYSWSTGATTANYLPGLCAGMYSVQVTDMMGCVASQTALVNQTLPITIIPSYTNASCGGACDGVISMTVSGGNPVYNFNWTPNLPNAAFANNLCPGSYSVVVTDIVGCTGTNTFTISSPAVNSISNVTLSTLSIKETCSNSYDGSIDLSITGSNSGPFTYQWNNGATSQDIFNLNSNIYSVTVFDASMNCLTIQDTITADGTNCGVITGKVFIDNNTDCINNSGDIDFNSALIVVNPGNRYGYTNAAGNYTISNLPYGNYSTSLLYSNGVLIPTPTCSTTINTIVNSGMQISNNNDFSIEYNSNTQPDMQVWGYSSPVVPGFIAHFTYQLSNLNNVNGTGLFKVVLPYNFINNITTASPNTYSLSGDTIIWNFYNITYSSGGTYLGIDFYVPVGTVLGSVVNTCMYAEPNTADLNYANNTYCYQRAVTGSFDPNDKTVNPIGVGPNGEIAANVTDLNYLIRFQNTGNGPAVNIVVKDTLSPNVDINTFEMLGSSHNYNIEILPGNILKWKFNNIMLPDSNSNEPGSHGYIQYRIKRTNNNTPGTQIKNTAYIYFDFNEPVVTNTAINTIETITGITSQLSNNDGWNVYPNPSTGALYIVNSTTVKEESQIQVLNSIGQIVFEETISSNYKNIDLSKLNSGVYFVKITSDKNTTVKRVVLSK